MEMYALITLKGIEGAVLVRLEGDEIPKTIRLGYEDIVWSSSVFFESQILATYLEVERTSTVGGTRILRLEGEQLHHFVVHKQAQERGGWIPV